MSLKRTRFFSCSLGAVALLLAFAGPARGHDSWFERLPGAPGGSTPSAQPLLLLLGTGNQFPERETAIGAEYLVHQGCHGAAGGGSVGGGLAAVRITRSALLLRAPAQAQSCWVQLTPFDIELAADKVAPYLDEMNASPALRATWAGMQARGRVWQERYTKHARIELTPGGASTPAAAVPTATGPAVPGMDATLQRHDGLMTFTVWRDGQPLPGLAVELRSALPATGTWHRTDAQGQLRVPTLPAGRWLLRAIDLRPSSSPAEQWDSRFLTLAFEGGAGFVEPVPAVPLKR